MRKFHKDCGCGGLPECWRCGGTGRVRDYEADREYADHCRDRDRDERLSETRAPRTPGEER
jgi:hypothetical protein